MAETKFELSAFKGPDRSGNENPNVKVEQKNEVKALSDVDLLKFLSEHESERMAEGIEKK